MEVCVDSVESSINAEKGGAIRVELCGNLMEGGTTPSIGTLKVIKCKTRLPVYVMIRPRGGDFLYTRDALDSMLEDVKELKQVIKRKTRLPVYVMIRPRGGDFLYTRDELDTMLEDVRELKQAGADGFVFGVLNQDGTVDAEKCEELLEIARPKPCTFHRGMEPLGFVNSMATVARQQFVLSNEPPTIDMTRDIMQAMETVISLGFERILTSGGDSSALEGLPTIAKMVKKAGNRIIIMPGGGINERNLSRILSGSGAKEFHGSARSGRASEMISQKGHVSMGASLSPPEFSVKVTDAVKVQKFVMIANDAWNDGLVT